MEADRVVVPAADDVAGHPVLRVHAAAAGTHSESADLPRVDCRGGVVV